MADFANADPAELARALATNDNYRIVKRYQKPEQYAPLPENRESVKTGVYLDVETTGFDHESNHIIELAMVKFTFSSDGTLFRLGEEYDELNDPGVPIPDEITRITGITDEMVEGEKFDANAIEAFIADASILVAHNANFDRKFVEASFPFFASKAWACSVSQINWRDAGFESAKLEYLAYRQGFFYSGHRAVTDCLAGIHVLSYEIDGKPALAQLLETARLKGFRLWAANAPFESKDLLKARGYRWNSGEDGKPKAWYKDLGSDELEAEQKHLATNVYGGKRQLPVDTINAFNRFSTRI
ncbi:MAG: 3'-5' exonuclease [Gammaproteobacteria bacterium]